MQNSLPCAVKCTEFFMQNTFEEKLYRILFVFALPFLLFFMAYYGFESSYMKIKTVEHVPDFMFSSVYAYRVLPNLFTTFTTELITDVSEKHLSSVRALILKSGTYFYHAIFLVNLIFFLLSSWMMHILLMRFAVKNSLTKLLHLLAVFFLVMAQYVPTNCDMMAVFMYFSTVFFSITYFQQKKKKDFWLLLMLVFVATWVRETACLSIAFFAAVQFSEKRFFPIPRRTVAEILALCFAFLLPYFGLRWIIPQETALAEGFYVGQNFSSPYNLAGLAFGILAMYFFYILCDAFAQKFLQRFLFFSLPYIVMIALVGLFWETRLFLPLIMTAVLASGKVFNVKAVSV